MTQIPVKEFNKYQKYFLVDDDHRNGYLDKKDDVLREGNGNAQSRGDRVDWNDPVFARIRQQYLTDREVDQVEQRAVEKARKVVEDAYQVKLEVPRKKTGPARESYDVYQSGKFRGNVAVSLETNLFGDFTIPTLSQEVAKVLKREPIAIPVTLQVILSPSAKALLKKERYALQGTVLQKGKRKLDLSTLGIEQDSETKNLRVIAAASSKNTLKLVVLTEKEGESSELFFYFDLKSGKILNSDFNHSISLEVTPS